MEENLFKGYLVGNDGVNISLLQYADDTIFFGEATKDNVIALQSHSTHMYHLQLSNSQKKMKPSHPLNSFPSKFKKHNTQEIIFHFKSNTWYASKTVEKETTP